MFEVSEKRLGRENMKWDFALGERKIGYRRHQYGAAWNERKHHQWVCWPNKKISGWIYRVVFLLVPPSFSTKNKTSKQPIAAFVIGWLAVFFFVLKFGGTSEKKLDLDLWIYKHISDKCNHWKPCWKKEYISCTVQSSHSSWKSAPCVGNLGRSWLLLQPVDNVLNSELIFGGTDGHVTAMPAV